MANFKALLTAQIAPVDGKLTAMQSVLVDQAAGLWWRTTEFNRIDSAKIDQRRMRDLIAINNSLRLCLRQLDPRGQRPARPPAPIRQGLTIKNGVMEYVTTVKPPAASPPPTNQPEGKTP